MSYAIPTDTDRSATCAFVEETTPSDEWVPVVTVQPGLNGVIVMRGTGYYRRHMVVHTVGASPFNTLMAGLKANEDALTYDGNTYSLLSESSQVLCSNDPNDRAKQCLVTLDLCRTS